MTRADQKMPVAFSEWLRLYLLTRGFSDKKTIAEKIKPLTLEVEKCGGMIAKFTKALKALPKDTPDYGSVCDRMRSSVSLYENKLTRAVLSLKEVKQKTINKTGGAMQVENVWDVLNSNDKIERVEVENDYLKVFTKRLYLHFLDRDYDEDRERDVVSGFGDLMHDGIIGRMVLAINATSKYGSRSYTVLGYNLDFREGNHQHPNIENHKICTGDYFSDLCRNDEKGSLAAFITAIITILEYPGDNGYIGYDDWIRGRQPKRYEPHFMVNHHIEDYQDGDGEDEEQTEEQEL